MPRKNKPKKEPVTHTATIYDPNFKQGCYGCPFAGKDFICLTSDGACLKTTPPDSSRPTEQRKEDNSEIKRRTNRKGAER